MISTGWRPNPPPGLRDYGDSALICRYSVLTLFSPDCAAPGRDHRPSAGRRSIYADAGTSSRPHPPARQTRTEAAQGTGAGKVRASIKCTVTVIIVTGANYIGDPNATVYSFGELRNGNMGNVTNRNNASDLSKTTGGADISYWRNPSINHNGNIRRINSPDHKVAAAASAVLGNKEYYVAPVPFLNLSPFNANSNSAAFAVSIKSEAMNGIRSQNTGDYFSLILPGASVAKRVEFGAINSNRTTSGSSSLK